MPFCYAPWSNIEIGPPGNILPCCKFRYDRYENVSPFNINTTSLDEYKNSALLNSVKQDFEAGKWPVGCERCRIEEENGIASKRQLDYQRWKNHYDSYDKVGWLTASIAFGNTCNLTCITCSPWASSRWQKEYQQKYKIDIVPNHFYKENFVDTFLSLAPDLMHLDISGGDPFISGVSTQFELLHKLIKQGRASKISLHYITNAMIFPNTKWWNLWSNFRAIELQLSIDGVGDRNSYIRHPSNWDTIDSHITLYQQKANSLDNLKLSVSHTVSAYNVYYLPEFFDWCQFRELPRPWAGRVHNPIAMRPSVWPKIAKEHIIRHLEQSQHKDCHVWAYLVKNTDDSEHFKKFVESIAWHDQYRGLDFCKTFPEMAQFI